MSFSSSSSTLKGANAMLQWMGGSRRKVSTSRKSTQSRQKQYFEQRKRRNRDIGLENYADGRNKRAPQHEEPRSLDIQSLRNVATVAQECEPVRTAMVQGCGSGCSFIAGDNPEADDTRVYCNAMKRSPHAQVYSTASKHSTAIPMPTKKVRPEDFSNLNEAKAKSGHHEEKKLSPKKVFASTHLESAPSCHKCMKAIAPDEQKRTYKNELSVIDILDDTKVHAYSGQRSEHEAHVAFSIRGLGLIGSETPVRSPTETNGVFFNGFPSLPKAAKRLHASVNFKHAMVDLNAEPEKSDSPFKSSAVTDCSRYSRNTEFINGRFKPLDAIDFSSKNFINEDEIFCSSINEKNEQICNARFGFLDDKFLDKRKCAVSEMIDPFQVEYDTSRSLREENHDVCDYGFEDPHMLSNRIRENIWTKYDIPEFAKQFASEEDYEMIALDDERHAPEICRSWSFRSMMEQPSFPCFDKGETMDTSSFLSGESCSSVAVRGERTKNLTSSFVKLKATKKGHSTDHWKSSEVNVKSHYMKKMMHANLDEGHQEKNRKGIGDCKNVLKSLTAKTSHIFIEPLEVQRISEPWHDCTFGEGFTSVHKEPYLNKESYDRHKIYTLHDDIPPAGCFFDQDVLEPVCSAQSNESQSFSSIRSVCMKPDIQLASGVEGQPPSSSCVFNLEKDDEVHDVLWRDVGNKGNDVLTSVPTNYRQALYEQPREVSFGNSDMSGNGKSTDFVDFKDSCSEHGEANDQNLEPIESSKARNPSKDGEETSDTIERPAKFKECIIIPQNSNNTAIPISEQSGKEENKTYTDGIRNDVCEGHCSSNLAYQVMLESYVLQLLCVQKVLKEASEPSNVKKS